MFNPYLFQFFTQLNYVIGMSEGDMYFLSLCVLVCLLKKSGANDRPRQNWNVLLLKVENNHAYSLNLWCSYSSVFFLWAKHVESLIISENHTENQFTNQICIRFQQKIILASPICSAVMPWEFFHCSTVVPLMQNYSASIMSMHCLFWHKICLMVLIGL